MHLVDALVKMQLTASGKAADCVSFTFRNVKMTLLKGPDALAARRDVASKLDHSAIKALRKPMHVDKPDWSLMQQLSDAGIGVCPTSGMPVFDPRSMKPGLQKAVWRAFCGVADTINTKQMGQTDEALEDLQMYLHEHAAQITEKKRLRPGGALAKRKRASSPAASSSDEGTDTGKRQRPIRPMSDDDASATSVPQFAGSDDTSELGMPQR